MEFEQELFLFLFLLFIERFGPVAGLSAAMYGMCKLAERGCRHDFAPRDG